MMFLTIILIAFLGVCGFTLFWWWRCRNPYKLVMIIGKKGAGKTTDIQKRTFEALAKGWDVYSSCAVSGAKLIDPKALAISSLPPNSLILIDEAGIIWNNRDYKDFNGPMREYFKLQRHAKHKIILYSQAYDVDVTLRRLADELWLMKNLFGCYSFSRRILRTISLVSAEKMQGEGQIVDDLRYDSLFFFWCGSVRFTFVPRYMKYFDSFEMEEKKLMEYKEIPIPEVDKPPRIVKKILKMQLKESA